MMTVLALASPADGLQGVASRPALFFVAVAALSLMPFLVLLMTSFVKIVLVLSILRSALGAAQIPPTQIITGLALILTVFIMAPTGERMIKAAEGDLARSADVDVLSRKGIEGLCLAVSKAKEPLREFLLRHASSRDRSLFGMLSRRMHGSQVAPPDERDYVVLVPAFLSSELRRAFEIGFLLLMPFLVVDLVVATLLAALGMQALSPASVALPFKLLLFVLADGWQLLLRGLVESYV